MRGVRVLARELVRDRIHDPIRDLGTTSIGRRLTGVAALICLSFGTVSGAAALTLAEFDRLPAHQKENFISTVLHFQHHRYSNSPDMAGKARCMVELDRVEAQSGDPYLLALIMRDLDLVRTNTQGRTVERVIREVIDRECKDY